MSGCPCIDQEAGYLEAYFDVTGTGVNQVVPFLVLSHVANVPEAAATFHVDAVDVVPVGAQEVQRLRDKDEQQSPIAVFHLNYPPASSIAPVSDTPPLSSFPPGHDSSHLPASGLKANGSLRGTSVS